MRVRSIPAWRASELHFLLNKLKRVLRGQELNKRGAAVVEFAVVLPILLLFSLTVADQALFLLASKQIEAASNVAAFYASSYQYDQPRMSTAASNSTPKKIFSNFSLTVSVFCGCSSNPLTALSISPGLACNLNSCSGTFSFPNDPIPTTVSVNYLAGNYVIITISGYYQPISPFLSYYYKVAPQGILISRTTTTRVF